MGELKIGVFQEYEVKIRVSEPLELISKIKTLNGVNLKKLTQHDTYYDFKNFELTKKDVNLRIRKEYNDDMIFLRAELSYKGSRRGRLIEIRPDTSLSFNSEDDINNMELILNRLGYEKLVRFIKQRERWRIKTIEFEVDKTIIGEVGDISVNLGSFCQATLETGEDLGDEKAVEILWKYLERLGYNKEDFEEKSYIELFFFKKNLIKKGLSK